jgi:hypothetical protein
MKLVRLSVLRTCRLYPPGNIPGTHLWSRLSQPQGHSAAGRIMSMKNSNDTIGNRTRDLPTCSAVTQTNCATTYPRYWELVGRNSSIWLRYGAGVRHWTRYCSSRNYRPSPQAITLNASFMLSPHNFSMNMERACTSKTRWNSAKLYGVIS